MAKFIETELGAYLNAKAISVIEPNVNYWSFEDVCVCVATISVKIIGEGLHVIGSWEAEKRGKTPDSWAPKQSNVADVERRLDNAIRNYIDDMSGIDEIHAGFRNEDIGRIGRALQECVYSET